MTPPMPDDLGNAEKRSALRHTIVAISVALGFALGVYLLLSATQPDAGLVSFTFLLILPAVISAFVAWTADPWRERSRSFYLGIPFILLGFVIVASVFLLREGAICVVILSPLWMISGVIGSLTAYNLRKRSNGDPNRVNSMALLAVPLIAMQIEPYIPLPEADAAVVRSIVVDATPAKVWPLLRGIPDVQPGEGRWNVSQDVLGIPRPVGATLFGNGIGADRRANWGENVRFREQITEWQPERRIGWRFIFDDIDGWKFTDRHLMPDSPYFCVTRGGYTVEPLADGRTRITLDTHYWIKTPVNGYSTLWGEVFLGDVQNNLLSIVKARAEEQPR